MLNLLSPTGSDVLGHFESRLGPEKVRYKVIGGEMKGMESSMEPEKVRYKVIGGEMKGMESSMKLVALGATQRKG